MHLKAKVYLEDQKKSAQVRLDARRAFLREKGFKDDAIRKDAIARKLKAEIRKADFRLSSVAALEKQNQDRAQAKADKLAAGKVPKETAKKKAKEEVPVKKEKKAKKEKSEKQVESEGKKEKPEKKTDQSETQ